MLCTCIEYVTEEVMRTVNLTTALASGGLAVTLSAAHISETKNLVNYPAWTESGFGMVARGLAAFESELNEDVGKITSAKISLVSTHPRMSVDNPYCILTLKRVLDGYKFIATGPVLGMSAPIRESAIPATLGDLLRLLLAICDPSVGQNMPSIEPLRTYEGNGVEPFVFVEELPEPVQLWFLAHIKQVNPSELHRQELVATARAYQEFCGIYA